MRGHSPPTLHAEHARVPTAGRCRVAPVESRWRARCRCEPPGQWRIHSRSPARRGGRIRCSGGRGSSSGRWGRCRSTHKGRCAKCRACMRRCFHGPCASDRVTKHGVGSGVRASRGSCGLLNAHEEHARARVCVQLDVPGDWRRLCGAGALTGSFAIGHVGIRKCGQRTDAAAARPAPRPGTCDGQRGSVCSRCYRWLCSHACGHILRTTRLERRGACTLRVYFCYGIEA